MGDLSMGVRNFLAREPEYRPTGLAYVGKKHPKVLIIGSGAGKDVLEALYFGASPITAVEINPIINDIVTKRMREHWGGLFEQPEVQLVTEDGRSLSAGQKKNTTSSPRSPL
jgi:spermidine synthase